MKIFGKAYLLLAIGAMSCGSFQNSSYYSDGIYGNADIVVVRKSNPQATPNANAYTQYFDEKSKQYAWEDDTDDLALTNIDSLGQDDLKHYKSNPNWGGGNKTTQIIIQDNRFNYGFADALWFNNFYNPWDFYWNRNFRFYNRWNWNRFAWGFNNPFYSPYTPFYMNGYYYDPYFYGGGFGYYNPYYARNRWNRQLNRNRQGDFRPSGRSYSSSYRGRARSETIARNRPSATAQNNGQAVASRTAQNNDIPNLVQQGRRQNQGQTGRRRSISEQNNRNYIDEVVRTYQNRGYSTEVINNMRQLQSSQGQSIQGRRRVYNNNGNTTEASKGNPSNANRRRTSNNGSDRYRSTSSQKSYQPSRSSYRAPSRSSYSSSRSSSSRSSSSRSSSSGRRRQ